MKKIICAVLIAALLMCSAYALPSVAMPSNNLFIYTIDAMNLLAGGAYDQVVSTVPFADAAPSAAEWKNFAEGNFTTLTGSTPQNRYVVLYWTGDLWNVAMPVHEPVNDEIEVLVLSSEDGKTFIGYGCSQWGDIREEYKASPVVRWTEEYVGATYSQIEFN